MRGNLKRKMPIKIPNLNIFTLFCVKLMENIETLCMRFQQGKKKHEKNL